MSIPHFQSLKTSSFSQFFGTVQPVSIGTVQQQIWQKQLNNNTPSPSLRFNLLQRQQQQQKQQQKLPSIDDILALSITYFDELAYASIIKRCYDAGYVAGQIHQFYVEYSRNII